MKLKTYSILVFGLIFIILYPIIFIFSEKKINSTNNYLRTYEYDIKGFISMNNISNSILSSTNTVSNLNNKYFKNTPVIKFRPAEKFSVSQLNYSEKNEKEKNSLKNGDSKIIQNNELILIIGNNVLFYFDLDNVFNFFKENLMRGNYLNNSYNKKCNSIEQNLISINKINYSVYEFIISIKQRNNSYEKKIVSKNEIISTFSSCFENMLGNLGKNLENHLENFQKLQNIDFDLGYNKIIKNENDITYSLKKSQKFKEDIYKIKNDLWEILINFDFNLKIHPTNYKIKEIHQKNFNMYVICFFLTVLCTIIIFYILFFLKNNIKFFNRIF